MKARLVAAVIVAAAFTVGVVGMYAAVTIGAHKADHWCSAHTARQASASSACVMSGTGR